MVNATKTLKICGLLLLAVALSSCLRDKFDTPSPNEKDNPHVTLSVRVPGSSTPATRALGTEQEEEVSELRILAFTPGDETAKLRYVGKSIDIIDDNGQTKKFIVELYSGTWDLMVLANCDGLIDCFGPTATWKNLAELELSKSDVQAALTKAQTGKWNVTTSGDSKDYLIPMWGVKNSTTVSVSSNQIIQTVDLHRMVAKISVLIQRDADETDPTTYPGITESNFELAHISLHNYNTRGCVIPELDDEIFDGKALKPSLPLAPGAVCGHDNGLEWGTDDLTDGDKNSALEGVIYTFEADQGGSYENHPCIVIGGYYGDDDKMSYYRADFIDASQNYLDILRNHHYIMNVRKISGRGYGSVEEAYIAGPTNIEVKVIQWNDGGMGDIVWDGQYYMSVNPGEIYLDAETFSKVFTVTTDVPLVDGKNWEAKLYADQAGTTELTGANKWFDIDKTIGDCVYPTKSTVTVALSAGLNTTGAERTGWIHINVGRLTYKVKVTQSNFVTPVGESNCYMIDNNNPNAILIPISQIQYAMNGASSEGSGFLGADWISGSSFSKLKAQVLWSDVNKFEGDDEAVVKEVSYIKATSIADGKILVVPGSSVGNAGVILYEDNDGDSIYNCEQDEIKWSWHIWNSDYYPYDGNGNPTTINWVNTKGFMDRNIGAITNKYIEYPVNHVTGFLYQWGRKDPLPGSIDWGHALFVNYIYYAQGSGIPYFSASYYPTTRVNLPNTFINPTQYYTSSGNSPHDWLSYDNDQNHDLWGGIGNSEFLHDSGKSAYDPCPEGYRVPKNGEWTSTGWSPDNNHIYFTAGYTNAYYGGYYPLSGYHFSIYPLSDFYHGTYHGGCYWSDTPSDNSSFYLRINDDGNILPSNTSSRNSGFSVRCRAEVEVEPIDAVEVGESNCYMIDNGNPKAISIPISQIQYAMNGASSEGSGFLGADWISGSSFSKLKAQVLWSDVNKFEGDDDAVVKEVLYNKAMNITDGKILVVPGSGVGNAGVILYEDNDGDDIYNCEQDKIVWSWHIWKSDYFPYASGYPGTNPTVSGACADNNVWMDRNIGAITNEYVPTNINHVTGLLYQWGRKDPFPGASEWNNTFNNYLHYAPESDVTFTTDYPTTRINLPNSFINPMRLYYSYGNPPHDWLSYDIEQNHDLWGGTGNSEFLHASGKSAYDPCPEGFRVPKDGEWTSTGWSSYTSSIAGYTNVTYGGYYPLAGFIGDTGYFGGPDNSGYYWAASQSTGYNSDRGSDLFLNSSSINLNNNDVRSCALSVRCRAE